MNTAAAFIQAQDLLRSCKIAGHRFSDEDAMVEEMTLAILEAGGLRQAIPRLGEIVVAHHAVDDGRKRLH